MRIAVFADKFSGTLTSDEVIGEIKKIFKYNNIKSSFFPVTDAVSYTHLTLPTIAKV